MFFVFNITLKTLRSEKRKLLTNDNAGYANFSVKYENVQRFKHPLFLPELFKANKKA